MLDVEDIIHYIKSLKKGFDKDEFQEKIEELSEIVDSVGLDNDEFHNLFKIWLNLCIPVTKWMSIGFCLVPRETIEPRTVEYGLRWILATYQNQTSFSRIGFLLDWYTAAMDTDSIDLESLDSCYEMFYMLLTYEILTPHAMKLVYTLTKPANVTRRRVVELLDIAKKRDAKKSKCRQIQALLGLFKSYKPECVPESVPAFSVHTTFRKLNASLLTRFGRSQTYRNKTTGKKERLMWVNPINMKGNRKAEPLVPNMEFANIGSKQYGNKEDEKNFLDFAEPAALVEYSVRRGLARPARLRALLVNDAGLLLLAAAPDSAHAQLSHDLHACLADCFLEASPYTYAERRDLLARAARLQRTLLQAVPVVTRFLAQYLPLWNEHDYFHEILSLCEWVSAECPEHVSYVVRRLARVFHRAAPLRQCAVLACLAAMYENMAETSKRDRLFFMSLEVSPNHEPLLRRLAAFTADLCGKALQAAPDDLRLVYWSAWCLQRSAAVQLRLGLPPAAPAPLSLALAALAPAPAPLDALAATLLLYKKLYVKLLKSGGNRQLEDEMWTLQAYTADVVSALWAERCVSDRGGGLVFNKLGPELAERLAKLAPGADAALGLRAHLAFAAYTYAELGDIGDLDHAAADNKLWFDNVIEPEFNNLGRFLKKVVPELKGSV